MKEQFGYRITLRRRALACITILALVSGCGGSNSLSNGDAIRNGDVTYTEYLEQTLDGTGASILDARTTNGKITVDGSAQGALTVQITKKVRASSEKEGETFAQKIGVHVERNGDAIRIYNEYPKPPRGVQVEVAYEIRCPSVCDIELTTLNGGIEIRGMEGSVDAQTTNGSIDLRGGTGPIALHTINGSIDASAEAAGEQAHFSTVNGSIDVEMHGEAAPVTATTSNGSVVVALPDNFSGQLDARTVNGRVRSDLAVTVTGTSLVNRLAGALGEGGDTTVKLRATNGDINLKMYNPGS